MVEGLAGVVEDRGEPFRGRPADEVFERQVGKGRALDCGIEVFDVCGQVFSVVERKRPVADGRCQ